MGGLNVNHRGHGFWSNMLHFDTIERKAREGMEYGKRKAVEVGKEALELGKRKAVEQKISEIR